MASQAMVPGQLYSRNRLPTLAEVLKRSQSHLAVCLSVAAMRER